MKFRLATVAVSFLALVMNVAPTAGQQHESDGQASEQPHTGLEIHEWGVFTAPRDALWLKQDMVAEWSSFPEFFHGYWPETELLYRGPVTKPVIFVHCDEKITFELQVKFATGRPLIWWPPAEVPNQGGLSRSINDGYMRDPPKSLLLFHTELNQGLDKQRQVADDHWLSALRRVDSASLSVEGGYNNFRSPEQGREQESFIYYDGVMQAPPTPIVTRTQLWNRGPVRLRIRLE